jgi:hypothetical protein
VARLCMEATHNLPEDVVAGLVKDWRAREPGEN